MLTAQQAMDDVRDQAQKEAQLIVTEAELKAEKLLHNAHSRVGRILDEISDLRRQRARFIEEVRGVISVHGKLLEVHDDEAVREAEDSEASVTVLDHVRIPSLPTAEEEEDTSTAKGQR
jgi:cell division initiation protein